MTFSAGYDIMVGKKQMGIFGKDGRLFLLNWDLTKPRGCGMMSVKTSFLFFSEVKKFLTNRTFYDKIVGKN